MLVYFFRNNFKKKLGDNKNNGIAVFMNDKKVETGIPSKTSGYEFDKYVCSDNEVILIWNNDLWNYSLSNVRGVVSCSLYFKQNYTENMEEFYAIPSKSSSIRLKIKKPLSSEGSIIKYKTSKWLSSDSVNSGTLVTDVVDDSNYNGNNNWLEINNLINGTQYFFKAFPYKNQIFSNSVNNETLAIAGGLENEYTMYDIDKNIISDTVSNNDMNVYGLTKNVSGKIGYAIQNFDNSNFYANAVKKFNPYKGFSVVLWFYGITNYANILDSFGYPEYKGLNISYYPEGLKVYFQNNKMDIAGNGCAYCTSRTQIFPKVMLNKWNFLVFQWNGSVNQANGWQTYLNDELVLSGEGNPNYSYSEIDQMEKTFSILNIYRYSSWRSPAMGETWPGNIKLDQLRIYNRSLSTNEIINLYQKGIGN